MTSQQTQTGNNYIMPIILTLISVFVIANTLFKNNDENLGDNLAVIPQETTEIVSDNNVAAQPITSTEPTQATDIMATDIAPDVTLDANTNTAALNLEAEKTAEITEPGVTSSTPALAKNAALEIFEINSTATVEDVQENISDNTTTQETASQELLNQASLNQGFADQKATNLATSQKQDSQKTDPAISANEEQSESMPAATAPVTPVATTETMTEVKSEAKLATKLEAKLETEIETKLEEKIEAATQTATESTALNGSAINNSAANSPSDNVTINKPIFITPEENKLIFIGPDDNHPTSNPGLNNRAIAQNNTPPNYAYPPQNYANQNYPAAQNQQQHLYQQQQRQQYYTAMQHQQAQQRAQQQAYQNEMQARQQRYLADMKTKQEQRNKAFATGNNFSFPNQQTPHNTEQKIKQIQQKISQLNEEIRRLKLNPESTQKLTPATQNTAPVSKQM